MHAHRAHGRPGNPSRQRSTNDRHSLGNPCSKDFLSHFYGHSLGHRFDDRIDHSLCQGLLRQTLQNGFPQLRRDQTHRRTGTSKAKHDAEVQKQLIPDHAIIRQDGFPEILLSIQIGDLLRCYQNKSIELGHICWNCGSHGKPTRHSSQERCTSGLPRSFQHDLPRHLKKNLPIATGGHWAPLHYVVNDLPWSTGELLTQKPLTIHFHPWNSHSLIQHHHQGFSAIFRAFGVFLRHCQPSPPPSLADISRGRLYPRNQTITSITALIT